MKKHLIAGLILLLPIALTIALIAFVVNFLTKPFVGFVSHIVEKTSAASDGFFIFSPEQVVKHGSQLIILICLFLVILIIGMIARWYFIHWFIQLGERIVHRLPIVSKVYRTFKDIVTHLFGQGKNTFKQVVMVPFPGNGMYTLGLLSQTAPSLCSDAAGEKLLSVFVPTTPNPTTGFIIMYKMSDIKFVDIAVEEAIKYIVSCGMVTPEDS